MGHAAYFVCQSSMCEPLTGFCHSDPIQGCRKHGHQGQLEGSVCMSSLASLEFHHEALGLLCSTAPFHIMVLAMAGVREGYICSLPIVEVATETMRPW